MTELAREHECAECGAALPEARPTGRPRRYCSHACRQRRHVERSRLAEVGPLEESLGDARRRAAALDDAVDILRRAVEDVERDLEAGMDPEELRSALDWLLEAARGVASP